MRLNINRMINMFHPVTTEIEKTKTYADDYINALIESEHNYLVIYPNNDLKAIKYSLIPRIIIRSQKLKIFPSLEFEYFLTLLKNADFIIGNSSAGVREAPYYGIRTIDIGSRQNKSLAKSIINNVVL